MLIRRFLLVSALWSSQAFSHIPGKKIRITGTDISLSSVNHSFAGLIKDRTVLGFKEKGRFKSEISLVDGDEKTTSYFSMNEEALSGDFRVKMGEDKIKSFPIKFIGADWGKRELLVKFGEREYQIHIEAEDFKNRHFINPKYTLSYEDKEIAFFTLEGGEACFGYSMHLVVMIFGAYLF